MFSKRTFVFLEGLEKNNWRDWFQEHRQQYLDDVQAPALEFIRNLQEPLLKVAPALLVSDAKVGGSLMRIHRDTRFSKDKQPYKTNVGIYFRHRAGKDIHAPGVYLHLAPAECFVGVGMWRPEALALRQIRSRIAHESPLWKRVKSKPDFKASFTLAGESLKTSPRDFPRDHPLHEDLRRKDFIAVAGLSRSEALSPDLPRQLVQHVRIAGPFLRFLCESVHQPW